MSRQNICINTELLDKLEKSCSEEGNSILRGQKQSFKYVPEKKCSENFKNNSALLKI